MSRSSTTSAFPVELIVGGVVVGENADYTSVIGARMKFTYSQPAKSIQWMIGGRDSTVANYIPTTTNGQVVLLTDEDLTKPSITFAWWKPGKYPLELVVETPSGETHGYSNTYTITAPTVRDVNCKSGVVAVGTDSSQRQLIRLADKDDFNKDGMYMNFVIAGTQSVAGKIGGFQLACNERVAEYSNGSLFQLKINGKNVLDVGQYNTVLYQNFTVPIGTTGDNINYDPHDGPGQELGLAGLSTMYIGDGHPEVRPETYAMYAMFKADLPESLWVPIKVYYWGWEGYTKYTNGAWGNPQEAKVPTPMATDPTGFPLWTNNTNDKEWVTYNGFTRR